MTSSRVQIRWRDTNLVDSAPQIKCGSLLKDAAHIFGFLMTREQVDAYLEEDASLGRFIRPLVMAHTMLVGREMYCLDLNDVTHTIPTAFAERIENVRLARQELGAEWTEIIQTPHHWGRVALPRPGVVLVIPGMWEAGYRVVPVARVDPSKYADGTRKDVAVCTASTFFIDSDSYYDQAVLSSAMHRAWCAGLGSRRWYDISTYQNFPWPDKGDGQAAQDCSQAMMSIERYRLARKADGDTRSADEKRQSAPNSLHCTYCCAEDEYIALLRSELDAAVDKMFGFDVKNASDEQRFAFLMQRYAALTKDNDKKKRKAE